MDNSASAPHVPSDQLAEAGQESRGPGALGNEKIIRPAPKGLALGALILGIIAFLTGLVPWLGLLAAICAVALGITALVKRQPKGLAIAGIALGSIALLAGLVSTVAFTAVLSSSEQSNVPQEEASEAASPAAEDPLAEAAAEPEPEPEVEAAPEPAETQEPEPAAPAGTVDSPLPQPYVAKGFFGGDNYSLTGRIVDANANALVNGYNQFNPQPPAGFKYVVVELTMTGINEDGVEPSLAVFDLSLATAEGNTYNSEFIVFGDGMPSMSDGPTLYPGSTFTGYSAYIVPEASQAFLLQDNGKYVSF